MSSINKADWDVMHVLRDPGTAAVIAGAAFQWNGRAQVAPVHAAFPSLTLMQSETECGNSRRKPGFNPDRPPNDFAYAAYTFGKLRDFISAGASSYMLWNMVLDEQGKNIDTEHPWPQNAAIVVDRPSRAAASRSHQCSGSPSASRRWSTGARASSPPAATTPIRSRSSTRTARWSSSC